MKKVKPKWFRHEAQHTTIVSVELIHNSLREHMYYNSRINPEFNKHIRKALGHLNMAYQSCNKENEVKGSITLPDDSIHIIVQV